MGAGVEREEDVVPVVPEVNPNVRKRIIVTSSLYNDKGDTRVPPWEKDDEDFTNEDEDEEGDDE